MPLMQNWARRRVLGGLGLTCGAALAPWQQAALAAITPRQRIIIDNDLGGDPDGLFQLAHHLASPSVEIALIVGSHLHEKEPFDGSAQQAQHAAERAQELAGLMRLDHVPPIVAGREKALGPDRAGWTSPASQRIVAEALKADSHRPLFYAAGASLTELAAAHRLDPRIGKLLKLAWIGGMEHPELNPGVPARTDPEYNTTIDITAARYIFNESDIEIWQVPRDTYRRVLISHAELEQGLAPAGRLGAFLLAQVDRIGTLAGGAGLNIGETYILGDSPLVTLTALQSSFEADSSSSDYVVKPTPSIDDKGAYVPGSGGRPMRVYRSIDTRLTFADMFAKLARSKAAA
ncbi:nucleoside hydrolase [Novosphingobium terrae]|uniref:nucleoside hydrolase n=1 Tax=Novosphingobium terrae TaxID=2726189 RepID=UPI001F145E68|nr:nucleoside hydrolase [Novosphingobium terrae]